MKKHALILFLVAVLPVFLFSSISFAYIVPRDNTKAEYLYVFGPEGNTDLGAHEAVNEQIVFINMLENETRPLTIDIYDADTGGSRDLKPSPEDEWDTEVEFSVYGKSATALASKVFDASGEYDRKYYSFGSFNKEEGVKIGNIYQFKVIAKALKGNDQNLFKLRITPESSEAFSEKISFRLLPNEGDKMFFFVGIPAGTSKIIVENYDLDPDGGEATLEDPLSQKIFRIPGSKSAEWASTPLDIVTSDQPRRSIYAITKKTQRYANAAVRVKDEKGNVLPIYYKRGAPIVVSQPVKVVPVKVSPDLKCNKFTFDATESYDPNKGKLSYLWDFGDGATSVEPVVTHIYEKGGEYLVKLTVTDASGLECDTSISTQTVKVNTPPVASFDFPDKLCAGSGFIFDASSTKDETPGSLTYAWDFGDGTKGEGVRVDKVYQKGGIYKVRLNVNDNSGSQCSNDSIVKTVSINSLPIADAGEDIDSCFTANQELKVNLNAGRSKDADGDELTYDWDFGDGKNASGKSVSHTFSRPGDYVVRLTVNDSKGTSCSSNNDTIMVKLNRQPIADAGDDVIACAGTAVTLNGSRSTGDGIKYTWDFGDGETATGSRVSHSYAKGGNYKAVLKVDDGKNTRCSTSSNSVKVSVNDMPSVTINNVESACLGNAVKFEASAKDPDGDALIYAWDFGDGETATGSIVSHSYAKGGLYTVRVTVDDKKGTPCSVASADSKVKINSRPIADAGPNLVCCIDKVTLFDASGSRDPDSDRLSYRWDFGDGSTAEGVRVEHAYSKSGVYTVMLTVDDNSKTACSTATASFKATVNESPVSVIKVR